MNRETQQLLTLKRMQGRLQRKEVNNKQYQGQEPLPLAEQFQGKKTSKQD